MRLAIALGAVTLAGVVRGFSGFGSSMVMTPPLAALYGPGVAVPIGLLLELLLTAPLLPGAARLVDWRRIGVLAGAATATVPLGTFLLTRVPPEALRIGLSAVIVSFVIVLAFGWRYTGKPHRSATIAAGATSGLLTGAAGIGGPPIVFYVLSGPDPAGRARASFIAYFAIVDLVALAASAWAGLFSTDVVRHAAMFTPVFLCAAWLGARSFGRAPEGAYRWTALGILTAVALVSLAG
jgi:hypothetical protein